MLCHAMDVAKRSRSAYNCSVRHCPYHPSRLLSPTPTVDDLLPVLLVVVAVFALFATAISVPVTSLMTILTIFRHAWTALDEPGYLYCECDEVEVATEITENSLLVLLPRGLIVLATASIGFPSKGGQDRRHRVTIPR